MGILFWVSWVKERCFRRQDFPEHVDLAFSSLLNYNCFLPFLKPNPADHPHPTTGRQISVSFEQYRGCLHGTGNPCSFSLGFRVFKSVVQICVGNSGSQAPGSPLSRGPWPGTLGSEGKGFKVVGSSCQESRCVLCLSVVFEGQGYVNQDGLIHNKI